MLDTSQNINSNEEFDQSEVLIIEDTINTMTQGYTETTRSRKNTRPRNNTLDASCHIMLDSTIRASKQDQGDTLESPKPK